MSGPLKSETDMLRTLARGTYTLAALYAHVEENADVARDDGHSPSAPGHSWDPRWRHRVRGWLANQRRAGRAQRITHAVWALEGTPRESQADAVDHSGCRGPADRAAVPRRRRAARRRRRAAGCGHHRPAVGP